MPVVVEHLADQQACARRHALVEPSGRRAGAGDGRRDVRAVAVAVDDARVGREVGGAETRPARSGWVGS